MMLLKNILKIILKDMKVGNNTYMKSLKLAFMFSFILLSSLVKAENQVFFSPKGNCEKMIVDRIKSAEKTIDAAVYSINNDNIVNALIDAKKRGVKVRILTDKTQAKGRSSKVKYLFDNGINIRVHSQFKIEHNKFAVYDKVKGSTGSFNWTNPAEKKNSENCIFFDDTDNAVSDYSKRFEYLWKINTKEKSEDWMDKHFE